MEKMEGFVVEEQIEAVARGQGLSEMAIRQDFRKSSDTSPRCRFFSEAMTYRNLLRSGGAGRDRTDA
jgi:hypothetical protein